MVSEASDEDKLVLVHDNVLHFDLSPLMDILMTELAEKENVLTKMEE